jgi:hypothetical protein
MARPLHEIRNTEFHHAFHYFHHTFIYDLCQMIYIIFKDYYFKKALRIYHYISQ